MLVTSQDVKINFMNYGEIVVPKGTRLTNQTAMDIDPKYNFVYDLSWIKRDYPDISDTLLFDATFKGINVPKEFVTTK